MLLAVAIAVASIFATRAIMAYEEDQSLARLHDEGASLALQIENEMLNDREQLEILASLAASHDDLASSEFQQVLESYDTIGVITRLEILLPGDVVLTHDGRRIATNGVLSFEEEARHGVHISNREPDIVDPGRYVIRNYVPVVRNGQTVAMLYGVIELGNLPDSLIARPYGGQAALCLINASTGDFLVDTWHDSPSGNIRDFGNRQLGDGFTHEQLNSDVAEGRSGYVEIESQTVGEPLLLSYQPVNINEWRIALSVPESAVFERANNIRNILAGFMGALLALLIVYLPWIAGFVNRDIARKQHRIDMLNYLYDVEKLLFSAHEHPEKVTEALERIAWITTAENVGFWVGKTARPPSASFWGEYTATAARQAPRSESGSNRQTAPTSACC